MSELTKLAAAVARVEEGVRGLDQKVDILNAATLRHFEADAEALGALQERLNSHAGRVGSLELTRARQRGSLAVLVALSGAFWALWGWISGFKA